MKIQILRLFLTFIATMLWGSADATPRDRLHVVYVTNQDRPPLPEYKDRIHRIVLDLQDFYRTEMTRNGYGSKTFKLDPDENRKVIIHLVTLDWDFDSTQKFSPKEISPIIAKHLLEKGIDIEQEYIFVFANAYWKNDGVWKFDAAYTGTGNPVRGITWVVDHELLDPKNIVPNQTTHINDRGHPATPGQFNVKMLGGTAHELGHSLGLPHNKESKEESKTRGTALMGTGNYTYRRERLGKKKHGTFLTPAHTFILSLHPLFTDRVPTDFDVPNVFINDLKFKKTATELLVSGTAVPSSKVAGVIFYHDPMPTGANKDYDAFSYLAKMNNYGKFTCSTPLSNSDKCALHLKVYFKNGMHTTFSLTQEKGNEVASLQKSYQWEKVKYAFKKRDALTLKKLIKSLEKTDPKAVKPAQLFLANAERWKDFKTPAKLSSNKKRVALSSSRWDSVSFGSIIWENGKQIPSYNGIMDFEGRSFRPLKSLNGPCPDGIFAHAPSTYTYNLGGRWKVFKSQFGIQRGQYAGSVVFIVKGDGKELFRSSITKLADGEVPLQINVSRVKKLDLITAPGPDGRGNDWSIWIAPTLLR